MHVPRNFKNYVTVTAKNDFGITTLHHIIFWLIYFLFNTFRWGIFYDDYLLSFKGNLLGFPIHIILCYFTVYFLIPRYVFRRKYVVFGLLLITAIFIMVWLKYILTYLLISQNVWPEGPETHVFTLNWAIVMMLGEFYVITFVTAIKTTIDWLRENRMAAQLKKEQLETELRFLRTQISPHFFFNTLNNIYSLSLEKSDKTPETIIKLSEFMKYLLYETKKDYHTLEKEIECIQNYLDLEKIRYGKKLQLDVNISGNPNENKIRPMLLIPFIENAFKHGANKTIKPVKIELNLKIINNVFYFRISNTFSKENTTREMNYVGGIGIENVQKRLELSYGKQNYDLDIREESNEFIVKLKLQLE